MKKLTPSSGGSEPWARTLWLSHQISSRSAHMDIHWGKRQNTHQITTMYYNTDRAGNICEEQDVSCWFVCSCCSMIYLACMASHFRISCQACSLFWLWILMMLVMSWGARSSSRQRHLQCKITHKQGTLKPSKESQPNQTKLEFLLSNMATDHQIWRLNQ